MSFETATLESLCELVIDCPHSTPKWTDEGIIVLRNQNIKNGILDLSSPSFTNENDYLKRIKRAIPTAGDIVFTREAPMGEVCMIPKGLKCCLGQRQVLLRPKSDVNGQYLFWALQSPYVQQQIAWNEGTGSTVSNVRIPVLKILNIPRINNENVVAKCLSDIASKLMLNTQTNQTLEQMAQAIFKSWFVDFDPVHQNMKNKELAKIKDELPEGGALENTHPAQGNTPQASMDSPFLPKDIASLFPDKLVESELGLIPEGWEVKQLKDILELAYGKALKKTDRVNGDIPVYGSGGLTGYNNQHLVDGPGIIVGRKGSVGTVYWEPNAFYPIDTVFYVKPKSGYSLNYCHIVLQNLGLKDMNTDAAVPGLNRNNAYRLDVMAPCASVLDKFESIMQSLQSNIDENNTQNETLKVLRDTLLPQLLSGSLVLNTALRGNK